MLALSPRQFSTMTPGEFFAAAEGARERQYRRREELAWAICCVVNYCSERLRKGQIVKPSELLGEEYTARLAKALEDDRELKERRSARWRREKRKDDAG